MLKMIIADDEPMITKGIQKLIDWKQLGIEIIGEYYDGAAALHGVFTLRPDIAILDISMPYKTGLDIINEIRGLGLETQVIFVSGFQEFAYVKEALSKGAVDYLLKPIKKEELLKSVEKCLKSYSTQEKELPTFEEEAGGDGEVSHLPSEVMLHLTDIEKTKYRPVVIELLAGELLGTTEERLVRFSLASLVEKTMQENRLGISFSKSEYLVMVYKGISIEDVLYSVTKIINFFEARTKNKIGAVIGKEIESMSDIPRSFDQCIECLDYLFFSNLMSIPIIRVEEPVFKRHYTIDQLVEYRRRTIDSLFEGEDESWLTEFIKYAEVIGIISDGQKENAWFYHNAAVRLIEDRFDRMSVDQSFLEMKEILEKGRMTRSYEEMTLLYQQLFERTRTYIKEVLLNHENKDIMNAKKYIDEHYMENLSLEVLANYIHLNPYYFSSFFKKKTGENFKDYLNKVRMENALRLLISSDKKSNEIADEVGFRDEKYFSKLFQKYYGVTPAQYRRQRTS